MRTSQEQYEKLVEKLTDLLDEDSHDLDYDTAELVRQAARVVERHVPRMAGDYEIEQAIHIGDKEVVFGINVTPASESPPYMVSYADTFYELGMTRFMDTKVGDDYLEVMQLFTERVAGQIETLTKENKELGVENVRFTADDIVPDSYRSEFEGKLMVVHPTVLRHEYKNAAHQLVLAESGSGCRSDSRGSAVYTTTIATGKRQRFERRDFMGELKPEKVPEWAKQGLQKLRAEKDAKKNKGVPER